jgi:hypothetical protein
VIVLFIIGPVLEQVGAFKVNIALQIMRVLKSCLSRAGFVLK